MIFSNLKIVNHIFATPINLPGGPYFGQFAGIKCSFNYGFRRPHRASGNGPTIRSSSAGGTSDSGPKRQQGSSFASVTQTPRRNYGHQLIRFTSVDFDDDVKSAVVSCVIRGQLFRVCRQCVNDARTSAVCARALCNLQSVRGRSSAGLQKQSDFLSFHPPRSPRGPVSPGALCYLNQSTMALTTITVVLVW